MPPVRTTACTVPTTPVTGGGCAVRPTPRYWTDPVAKPQTTAPVARDRAVGLLICGRNQVDPLPVG
jgi:hypothetical protein